MIEIGYNIANCVGSGTIYGLLQDRLFWGFWGIVIGASLMILFIKYKEKQLKKINKDKK